MTVSSDEPAATEREFAIQSGTVTLSLTILGGRVLRYEPCFHTGGHAVSTPRSARYNVIQPKKFFRGDKQTLPPALF